MSGRCWIERRFLYFLSGATSGMERETFRSMNLVILLTLLRILAGLDDSLWQAGIPYCRTYEGCPLNVASR